LLLLVNATTAGNDLGGAEVRRIRTLAKYLDSDNFGSNKLAITQGGDSLVTQGSDNLEFSVVVTNATADPNARFPDERWFIDRKSSETRDSVTFELASKFDLAGQKIPKRQVIANVCQWKYRSSECSYTGSNYFDVNGNSVSTLAEDVCGKRVASCKLRFGENAELPFGSFPGAGLTK
jgi:lambda family phage minor tail protein L